MAQFDWAATMLTPLRLVPHTLPLPPPIEDITVLNQTPIPEASFLQSQPYENIKQFYLPAIARHTHTNSSSDSVLLRNIFVM